LFNYFYWHVALVALFVHDVQLMWWLVAGKSTIELMMYSRTGAGASPCRATTIDWGGLNWHSRTVTTDERLKGRLIGSPASEAWGLGKGVLRLQQLSSYYKLRNPGAMPCAMPGRGFNSVAIVHCIWPLTK